MWVFDGEEWTQEGGSSNSRTRTETARPQWADEFVPELQVIEIVHVQVPKHIPLPTLPLP